MKTKILKFLNGIENQVAYFSIILMALFPLMEMVARTFFHTGVPYSTDYTKHLVLVLTFAGAMITSREKKHLALSLDFKLKEPWKTRVLSYNGLLSSMITVAFAWSSLSFLAMAFAPGQKLGLFPIKLVVMVMPVGFIVIAVRFITSIPSGIGRRVASLGFLLGTFLAFQSVLNIFYPGGEYPEFIIRFNEVLQVTVNYLILPIIIMLILSAVFGGRIFVVLGGIGYLLFIRGGLALAGIPNEAYVMLCSDTIPAIPLFTVVGFLLSESKAGERLVRVFRAFISWVPGGLGIMAILVCAFFTTFTGASGVTILALGALLSYVLVSSKYKKKFSVGLLTASGSIGLLFPPSLPIIIYGVAAGVNIKHMFVGGIMPGVVMVTALVVFVIFYAVKNKVEREPLDIKEAFAALKAAAWEILLPFVILVSYFGGLTNLLESAAIAVFYALIVEVFINKDLKIKELPGVLLKAIPIIGGVLIILAMAKGLSYYIIDAEVPMQLAEWAKTNIGSKYIFLLLLNIGLLITGCFMDIFSAIMVVVPLILPLGEIFGIHPVHLGIIFLANMELGYLTPPVGLNLFLASYRFEEPISKVYRDVLPFFVLQLITVLLITYIPFLSTGLLAFFN
jgi:C4-dicarboxylate transporter, DctM subunit